MITTGVDVLWIMFWLPYYNDREIAKFNYGLHMFVVIVSMIEVGLKVVIFLMLFLVKETTDQVESSTAAPIQEQDNQEDMLK